MSDTTKIEWTDHSWSPWEGCTKVSPGCAHCYAEALNHRFGKDNWGKGKPRRRTKDWTKPVRWNQWVVPVCNQCGIEYYRCAVEVAGGLNCPDCDKVVRLRRQRVFPSVMDWLDDEVPIEWLADFLRLIHETPALDWLLLTKRTELWPERMRQVIALPDTMDRSLAIAWFNGQPPANVWIGASVEDQRRADERIPELLKIPANVRFLSLEPLLGPVDLKLCARSFGFPQHITKDGRAVGMPQGIDWVIIGGESGPGARPCHVEWVRDLVRQGQDAGVPVFVKQLGARPAWTDRQVAGQTVYPHTKPLALNHPKGGDPFEWSEDLRIREFPKL